MKTDNFVTATPSPLRHRAEMQLKEAYIATPSLLTVEGSQELVHELHVHQIELELQNEELRRVGSELEAVLSKYSDLYDFAPVGYFTLDSDGTILSVNLSGADLLGIERSLLLKQRLNLFVSIETRPVLASLLDTVFARKTKETCEVVLLREKHSPRHVQIQAVASESKEECLAAIIDITDRKYIENELHQAHLVLENKVTERTRELAQTVAALQNEITERKRAEEELRSHEEELKTLLEVMPVGVGWSDNDGNIQYVNRFFIEQFGYSPEEIPTISDWFIRAYPDPENRETVVSNWKAALSMAHADGTPIPPLEVKITCKDGSVRHVIINTQLVLNRTLNIFTDITEHKLLEDDLLKTQKLESLGVLAGGIAHDFNNILTAILGNISFAQMFLDASHKSFKPLETAKKASNRAAKLANQLLTFAMGGNPIKQTVSVQHLVNESLSLVLSGTNVEGIVTIPDSRHTIEADEGQMVQAFNNIITNSVQAMPEGGKLSVQASKVTLNDSKKPGLPPGEYIKLSFSDEGCGIPEEIQQHIFDPYFTTKPDGAGLGLASAYSIINKHGGLIDFHSGVDKGTTFTIYLPTTEKPLLQVQTGKALASTGTQTNGSILIMDDEEMIRELVAEILASEGYQVTSCSTGEEAITLYKEAKEAGTSFSAVIMDLTIPGGMGGKEAAQHILAFDPAACLITSSGYSNDPVMAEYADHGFRAAVIKPYSTADLVQAVQLAREFQ